MKILNTLKQISKAYTEGIYADTPANRKLGRVGMSYANYAKKLKEEKEKAADKKYYFVRLSDGEELMLEEGATSQEKAIDLAINYATDMVRYNGYKEFKFDLEENIDNWTDEQIDNEKWDWFSIRAKKHGDKIEVSVYNWNTHEYLRNDTLKREQKNLAQQVKREREKSNKEFQERFGWMDEFLTYQRNKEKSINIPNKVYHKASPTFRENILKEGLKPQVGPSYSAHWEGEEEELTPIIFAYDKDKKEYNSTYDDDIYEIDTSKLDKESWDKDKDEYMYDTFGSIVYNKEIPKDAIKLIYRGTGNSID